MNHIKQIAARLEEYALDAMLITSPVGERYAMDFHGEGLALISKTDCWYFTDSRYIEAAHKQISGAHIDCVGGGRGHRELVARVMKEHRLERVGFESDRMSVDALERYQQALDCTLIAAPGLISGLRPVKDGEELARIKRAQAITDRAFSNILDFIRPGMTEREVSARLVYDMMRMGGESPPSTLWWRRAPTAPCPTPFPVARSSRTGCSSPWTLAVCAGATART